MWILSPQLLFYLVMLVVTAHCDARYECGSNGRFEYCIDGNPSCVIGCHCYPGYYFDTETKICEPNMKLIQTSFDIGSRRKPSAIEPPVATTTESHPAHVEISNKDAEDIGDWLYNQFFKTIENQVINSSHTEAPVTRRKGGDSLFNSNEIPIDDLITRRSRKRVAKKHKKQEDLRRKLLRISEDDSLFRETKESSSSDDDSSDSSSSESHETKKGNSKDDKPKNDHNHNRDDDDHDVKEIIAFNKVPKPALPPFVFLPGMQTPFFSPALGPSPGLIPPLMSMFPMPPGAPMFPPPGPPMFPPPPPPPMPFGGGGIPNPPCNSSTSGATITTNSPDLDTKPQARSGPNYIKHKRRPAFRKTEVLNNQKENLGIDFMNDTNLNMIPTPEEEPGKFQDSPPPETGDLHDFRYLSELIHEPSKHQDNPQKVPNTQTVQNYENHPSPAQNMNAVQNQHNVAPKHNHIVPSSLLSGRRSFYDQDDTYYTKLGREIASLIRNINPDADDDTGTPQDRNNMERQRNNNERYGSKTYWERAIRSPLHIPENWLQYNTKSNITNDDLYEIENKAKYAATTLPSFNLEQLENIINFVNKPYGERPQIFYPRESNVINIVHDIVIENTGNETLNIKLDSANVVDTVTRVTDKHFESPSDLKHKTEHHYFDEFELKTENVLFEKLEHNTQHHFFNEFELTTENVKIIENNKSPSKKSNSNRMPVINPNVNITGIKPIVGEVKTENVLKVNDDIFQPKKNKTHEVPPIWELVKRHNKETIKNFRSFRRHLSQKPKFLKVPRRPGGQIERTKIPHTTTTTAIPYSKRYHLPFKYFQNSYFERFK